MSIRYHWAMQIGPKAEVEGSQGKLYPAKETLTATGYVWGMEERGTTMLATNMQLVRVLIGKVEDRSRLETIFRKVPIRKDQPGWNCVGWIKEALEDLGANGKALGASVTDWQQVRNMAMQYIERKKREHRFDGTANFDMRRPATFDMLENKETIV
jgi:hypothetical protein